MSTNHIYTDLIGNDLVVTLDATTCSITFEMTNATALLTMVQARSLAAGIDRAINDWREHTTGNDQ